MTTCIPAGNKYHRREKNPWIHNAINLERTGGFIGTFVGRILLRDVLAWGLYLPVASFVSGLLLFALFILVVHEVSHNMFVLSADPDRQKGWNRVIGWVDGARVALLMGCNSYWRSIT